jgi:predicted NBD/HSP70 family sugar kinase
LSDNAATPARVRRTSPGSARGTTQDAVRRHNLAALLRYVHSHGPTSRAELTKALQLNRSTIGALVEDLEARGLVAERGATELGTPGRPSNVVQVRDDRIGVLAIAIGVDAVVIAAVAPGAQVLQERQVSLDDEADRGFDRVLTTLCREAKVIVAGLPADLDIVGVGIAVPGVVRREDGLVHHAPNLGWREVPLGARLASRLRARLGLDLVVSCRNDASLGALAEHTRGTAMGVSNLLYVYGEVGVGGGIVADGHLLEGAHGYGGEVGHMRVNPDGAPCRCGSRGCWETEIGEDALVTLAGRHPGGRSVVEEVLLAARHGDQAAEQAVQLVARWTGVGLANLVNCLNPEMVVLGGLLSDLLDVAGAEIRSHMRDALVTPAHLGVQIVAPQLGAESVLLGAAEVALEPILADPTLVGVPRFRPVGSYGSRAGLEGEP